MQGIWRPLRARARLGERWSVPGGAFWPTHVIWESYGIPYVCSTGEGKKGRGEGEKNKKRKKIDY